MDSPTLMNKSSCGSMMQEVQRLEDETVRVERKDVIETLKSLEVLKRKIQSFLKR